MTEYLSKYVKVFINPSLGGTYKATFLQNTESENESISSENAQNVYVQNAQNVYVINKKHLQELLSNTEPEDDDKVYICSSGTFTLRELAHFQIIGLHEIYGKIIQGNFDEISFYLVGRDDVNNEMKMNNSDELSLDHDL